MFVPANTYQRLSKKKFYFLGKTRFCGGASNLIKDVGTVIMSPDYPKNYKHNSNCRLSIEFPNDTQVQLQFLKFDLQNHSKCAYDWLNIIGPLIFPDSNSESSEASNLPSDQNLAGEDEASRKAPILIRQANDKDVKICGNILPSPITAKENKVQLIFRSDGSNSKKGLKMIATIGMV